MTTLRWFSLCAAVVLCASCADEAGEKQPETAILSEDGTFRGYQLGDRRDQVLNREKWTPAFKSDSLIKYEKSLFLLKDSVEMNVFLAFDELGLFEIQADLYSHSTAHLRAIDSAFSKSLTQAYGEADTLGLERRWTTYSKKNNTVEITMSQEANTEGERFVSLNYLEPLDDAY
jgi:hypothetical protein